MSESVAAWAGFYSAVANASAALLGLVFVGMSLRLTLHAAPPAMRSLAYGAAVALAQPIMASLAMLVPVGFPWPQAAIFVLLALGGGASLIAALRSQLASRPATPVFLLYRYGLPLGACGLLFVGALGLLAGVSLALYAPAIYVFAMFSVGIENAWDLLVAWPGSQRRLARDRITLPGDDRRVLATDAEHSVDRA